MPTKVAVIGGGPLGLMALKNFREDGFDATLFESRNWIGGLWKYSDDKSLSVAANTVFNTSKYRTGISDFPVPEHMDDFPPAEQIHDWLESYCDHFDLKPHIKLNSPVNLVKRQDGQWILEIGGDNPGKHFFDKVAFSCGPFSTPKHPTYEGIEDFQGQALHSVNFHNPSQFKGKRVVVVGLHASAQDVVESLSQHGAAHAYLSHRSGQIFIPRYTKDGSVYDRAPPNWFTILGLYLGVLIPRFWTWVMDKLIHKMSNDSFPNMPDSMASNAGRSVSVSPPLIGSELYRDIQSGFCEPVAEVKRIVGPRSVELKSGRVLKDIDAIIYCTGYYSGVPVNIEPKELNPYPIPGEPPNLYRGAFSLHPDPAIRNSLAFLGQGAVYYPGFAPHEMIGLAVSQIWQGKSSLPPLSGMQRWHRWFLNWREDLSKRYDAASTFFVVLLPATDMWVWLDETAGLGLRKHFGLVEKWTSLDAWKFWWNNRELYHKCLSGVPSPAVFRLFDEGKRKPWRGAKEQVYIDDERAVRQQKERLKWMEKQKSA